MAESLEPTVIPEDTKDSDKTTDTDTDCSGKIAITNDGLRIPNLKNNIYFKLQEKWNVLFVYKHVYIRPVFPVDIYFAFCV